MLTLLACGNNTTEKNTTSSAGANEVNGGGAIVGTWTPIAIDFSIDGKDTPSGNWRYNTKQDSLNVKEAGYTFEDGNYNFKANGTVYRGKTEPTDPELILKYKKMAEGKWCYADAIEQNTTAKNVDVFYMDAKRQLIHHTSKVTTILGKETLNNSFELYKRN